LKHRQRNRIVTRIKLMATLVMALMLGIIYFSLKNDQAGINDRSFLLLYSAILLGVRATLET